LTTQPWPPADHQPGVSLAAILFWAAILSTLPVLWITVGPSLAGGARIAHESHWLWVLLHGLTGLITLASGFLALWMGWTRRGFGWHRHTGCTYVGAGMTMAFIALFMAISNDHASPSLAAATGTLALFWLGATIMGWRRGSQRQWRAHQMWMIRSMVLTWSFVFCRLAQRVEDFEGIFPALGVWLYWIVPLLIAEAALWQWRRQLASR